MSIQDSYHLGFIVTRTQDGPNFDRSSDCSSRVQLHQARRRHPKNVKSFPCTTMDASIFSQRSNTGLLTPDSNPTLFSTDSSSGLAVGLHRALGRLRHVQTRHVWVQQRVEEGDLRLKKEPGDTNVSDVLTKSLDERRMTNMLTAMGYEFRDGRTSLAPEAR